MNTPTADELLEELANELVEPEIPPGSITVQMLMVKSRMNEKKCRTFLEDKVRQGVMGVVLNKITKWYFIPE